jgi:hypothetical protein
MTLSINPSGKKFDVNMLFTIEGLAHNDAIKRRRVDNGLR